jgi:hypothetical protein
MLNVIWLLVLAGCSPAAAENWSAAIVVGARATEQKPTQGGLVGAEAKARCGGFGAAQAAEILGFAASAVTSRVSDVTPATKGCEFNTGDKKISFSLSIANSIEEAKRDMENMREGYVIAARAQEGRRSRYGRRGSPLCSEIVVSGDGRYV